MSRFRTALLGAALPLACLFATPASAQRYDSDCKPVPAEERRDDIEIAKTWLPIGLGLELADRLCAGHNFIKKLFEREPDPEKVTPAEVFEAVKPDVPPALATTEPLRRARDAEASLKTREAEATPPLALPGEAAAGESTVILPPTSPDGFIAIFEGKARPATADGSPPDEVKEISGEGVLISAESMEAGNFEKGELEGPGQEITSSGTWRGGNYVNGEIEGPGWEVGEDDGKRYALAATFKDDKPDGLTTVSMEDGSSRHDLWRGGERLMVGSAAPVGKEPFVPVYKSPAEVAAAEDAAFEASLDKAPNAGVLYAQADELIEQGNPAKARKVLRALVRRFPTSPLAERAADRMAALGSGGAPGSARAPASGSSPSYAPNPSPPSGSAGGGSYAGEFVVRNPVLPASFYAKYRGSGMSIDALRQMENTDPLLQRLKTATQSTTDTHLLLKYSIASLEGLVVIWRQAAPVPGGREQINGWISQHDQAITTCQQISSDSADCLRPIQ